MSDSISKKFIQEALIERISKLNAEGEKSIQTARELIRFTRFVDGLTPSADAVEVVRCKDCKWHLDGTEVCQHLVWDDDFCSFRDRRTDD